MDRFTVLVSSAGRQAGGLRPPAASRRPQSRTTAFSFEPSSSRRTITRDRAQPERFDRTRNRVLPALCRRGHRDVWTIWRGRRRRRERHHRSGATGAALELRGISTNYVIATTTTLPRGTAARRFQRHRGWDRRIHPATSRERELSAFPGRTRHLDATLVSVPARGQRFGHRLSFSAARRTSTFHFSILKRCISPAQSGGAERARDLSRAVSRADQALLHPGPIPALPRLVCKVDLSEGCQGLE